jgi:hypothetical protein
MVTMPRVGKGLGQVREEVDVRLEQMIENQYINW